MATVYIRHHINYSALGRLYTGPPIAANMFLRGLLVESRAKTELERPPRRVDTGRLRADIHTRRITRHGLPGARIGTGLRYSLWVHDGTGIYGPRHARIYPRHASVLKFTPKGARGPIYVRSTKGMKPNKYLLKALPAAKL